MNIYLSAIRILLVFGAFTFLVNGVLFFMQNWQGASKMLGIGMLFLLTILVDVFITKKVFRSN